jgi:hypothetical protein
VWAFTGAKRPWLLVFLPCLFAYVAFVCWTTWDHLDIFSAAFLLGNAGCFRGFPNGYNPFSGGVAMFFFFTQRSLCFYQRVTVSATYLFIYFPTRIPF